MSHHGRIEQGELDVYFTPSWSTEIIVNRLEELSILKPDAVIGEPCAGRGDIVRVLEQKGYEVVGSDLDPMTPWPSRDATLPSTLEHFTGCDVIVTNPPYSAPSGTATEVVENFLKFGIPMAFLVRLSWLEPLGRREGLFETCQKPAEILVLPRVHYSKPDGLGADRQNPQTSVWAIWYPNRRPTQLRWATSVDEAQARGQIDWIT